MLQNQQSHTPGPWGYYKSTLTGTWMICEANNLCINGEHIAIIAAEGTQAQREANARLIAASPSLAKACALALERMEPAAKPKLVPDEDTVLEALRQALTQAGLL